MRNNFNSILFRIGFLKPNSSMQNYFLNLILPTAIRLRNSGIKVYFHSYGSIESFSKEIHTPIDIVFFLSAILPGKSLEEYDLSLMEKVMTVNFTGQAMLLKKLIPHLSKDSQIIIMSSISADRGSYDPMYSASKAAQHGFVKSLALQLAPNTRINIISPGLVDESSMFNDMQSQTREKHLLNTPMKRLTTKKEIVGIMINLCDPAWANVTGQVIRVNGGAYV
jgi:3-oxoacyl-[acyl-carrier protein] reductase